MAKVFLKKMCSMYVKMKLSSSSCECTLHYSVLEKYGKFFVKAQIKMFYLDLVLLAIVSLTGQELLIFIRFDKFLDFVIFLYRQFRSWRNKIKNEMICIDSTRKN